MAFTPYLSFNGNCREAIEFYQQVLGGEIVGMQTWGNSPMAANTPPETHNRIMNARLVREGSALMAGDAPTDGSPKPTGFCVAIDLDTPAEVDRVFNAFSAGGSVEMPPAETFWTTRFAMCTDRFGTPWMLNCSQMTTPYRVDADAKVQAA
jgi:PhnB protein